MSWHFPNNAFTQLYINVSYTDTIINNVNALSITETKQPIFCNPQLIMHLKKPLHILCAPFFTITNFRSILPLDNLTTNDT